jgi:glucose-1-phosphate adenylyltransferase
MVIARADLQNIVSESLARGLKSFHRDILAKNLESKLINTYAFDGWYSVVSSMEGYFESSMKLLCEETRRDLFGNNDRRIYTKIRNSAPTKYMEGSKVKNSLLADGCVIEGTVENCILFRNVHIGKGTTVKNCILLQDTYVGSNVFLNCVVTDKNVVIKDDRILSGHQTTPFFIGKNHTI